MTINTLDKHVTKRPRKVARIPRAQDGGVAELSRAAPGKPALPTNPVPRPSTPKAPTKTDIILDLLARAQGATLAQMVDATGWLPHTTRAALTGLKKKGHEVTSAKSDDVRTYRVTAAQQAEATTGSDLEGSLPA